MEDEKVIPEPEALTMDLEAESETDGGPDLDDNVEGESGPLTSATEGPETIKSAEFLRRWENLARSLEETVNASRDQIFDSIKSSTAEELSRWKKLRGKVAGIFDDLEDSIGCREDALGVRSPLELIHHVEYFTSQLSDGLSNHKRIFVDWINAMDDREVLKRRYTFLSLEKDFGTALRELAILSQLWTERQMVADRRIQAEKVRKSREKEAKAAAREAKKLAKSKAVEASES